MRMLLRRMTSLLALAVALPVALAVALAVAPSAGAAPPPKPRGVDAVLEQARSAYARGRYRVSIRLAEAAIRQLPAGDRRLPGAWKIVGSACCSMRARRCVAKTWPKLDDSSRQFVRFVCKSRRVRTPTP